MLSHGHQYNGAQVNSPFNFAQPKKLSLLVRDSIHAV